jgi:signal transduction histidine kinase
MRLLDRAATYAAAAIFVGSALAVRWMLDPWLGDSQPLSLLFGGVALAVWLGGAGPAVVATLLGYFASDYLFIPPRGVFGVFGVQEAVSLLTYLLSCGIIVAFGEGLRRATRRTKLYADGLERAERHKDQFLAVLAHELRNLLAPIRHAVALLRVSGRSVDNAFSPVAVIDRQTGHMARLIDDLFDIARIANGRLHLQCAPLDIKAPLLHAIEAARPSIDSASHELRVNLPYEPTHVRGDLTRLAQVFANLLNNACRYTPRGGHIWVEAYRSGRHVVVKIRDDGIGIRAEALPRIFEMFTRGEGAEAIASSGLGIGLTFVRRVLELHGGEIRATSDGAGKGSQFEVRLPAIAASELPAPQPAATPKLANANER